MKLTIEYENELELDPEEATLEPVATTISTPTEDPTAYIMVQMFERAMMGCGFSEESIADAMKTHLEENQ